MKCIKLFQSIKNVILMLFILMTSTTILSGNQLFAQNMSLMTTPLLMNKTAGEINSFNIFQIVSNPANLESLKKFNIGFYSERKFNLMEMSNHIMVSGFSFGEIKMGLIVRQAGTSKFNQHAFGFCLSKKIGENTSMAIQSSFLQNNISKYLNQKYIAAEVGLVTNLSRVIKMGFTAENYMSFNKQTSLDHSYLINISTGVFYEISKQFSLNINCYKKSNLSAFFSGNMKYQIHKKIALNLGFFSNTNSTNIDISYSGKKINFVLITTFHPILGITSGTSISTVND